MSHVAVRGDYGLRQSNEPSLLVLTSFSFIFLFLDSGFDFFFLYFLTLEPHGHMEMRAAETYSTSWPETGSTCVVVIIICFSQMTK
jgi:hypothetical protein